MEIPNLETASLSSATVDAPSPGGLQLPEHIHGRARLLAKKLLGSKKPSKLLRLGVQQLIQCQPEYQLYISNSLISSGQYARAFNFLRRCMDKKSVLSEYHSILLHHYMYVCHKLVNKFLKKRLKEQELAKLEKEPSYSISILPNSPKKKASMSLVEKLGILVHAQCQNLLQSEKIVSESRVDTQFQESISDSLKENFIYYYLQTSKSLLIRLKQENERDGWMNLLQNANTFICNLVDYAFGDFKNMKLYRLCGDLIQMKANVYFECQNFEICEKLYAKALKYYHFAGQIALKKFHSVSPTDVTSVLELNVESAFSSISVNLMMTALSFEGQSKYDRMIEALRSAHWINERLLIYEFSDKLRIHIKELLKEAEIKYNELLEEKGEIRRVVLRAFPDLAQMEQKQRKQKDLKEDMVNRMNSYLYEKAQAKQLNSTLVLIKSSKKQIVAKPISQMNPSLKTFESPNDLPVSVFVNGHLELSTDAHKNGTIKSPVSSEKIQKIMSQQSFSDYCLGTNQGSITAPSHSHQRASSLSQNASIISTTNNSIYNTGAGGNNQTLQTHNSLVIPNTTHSNSSNNKSFGYSNNNNHKMNSVSLQQINEKDTPRNLGVSNSIHTNFSTQPSQNKQINQHKPNNSIQQGAYFSSINDSRAHKFVKLNKNKNNQFTTDPEKGTNNIEKKQQMPGVLSRTNSSGIFHEHDINFKPKLLSTNKYFAEDAKPSLSQENKNFKSLTESCASQEKRFHYLNFRQIDPKREKQQGVLSLDYAMENLIKEKIIQRDISQIYLSSSREYSAANAPTAAAVKLPNTPLGKSSNLAVFQRSNTSSSHLSPLLLSPSAPSLQTQHSPNSEFFPQSSRVLSQKEGQSQKQDKILNQITEDKQAGKQIRNLMSSLNISMKDQRVIIDDLWTKFEAEKKSIYISSKSKMSQQGWTTDKILSELMKSINILGENVNTYNQRFSQFLSTIKDEDFDKSEFNICLRKLVFRQRMGNGIIPTFFAERELPLARIQERRVIDDAYYVVQSGGERMIDIMSDHKIIKNLFEDHLTEPPQGNQKNLNGQQVDSKDSFGFSLPPEKKGSEEGISKEEKSEPAKPVYKQKPKKMVTSKTNAFQDIGLLQSSESNVDKLHFEGNVKNKVDFFQKSQESLRQMVLKSETDGEEMQKMIQNPKKNIQENRKQKSLVFLSFQNELATSIGPFSQKEKSKRANSRADAIELLKLQNKRQSKTSDKNNKGLDISDGSATPLSSRLNLGSHTIQNTPSHYQKSQF